VSTGGTTTSGSAAGSGQQSVLAAITSAIQNANGGAQSGPAVSAPAAAGSTKNVATAQPNAATVTLNLHPLAPSPAALQPTGPVTTGNPPADTSASVAASKSVNHLNARAANSLAPKKKSLVKRIFGWI
jgi:hypothetical protein